MPTTSLHTRIKRAREGGATVVGGAIVRPAERTPTEVLKSILLGSFNNSRPPSSSNDGGDSSSSDVAYAHNNVTFTKPSDADIAAYDLEAVQAVRASNVDRLRQLWVEGKSMNACNQFGESLLHMACRRADLPTVKFLILEAKVRTDRCDDFGRNPFHDALWTSKPNFEVVEVLIGAAHPRLLLATDVRGNPPFAYARSEHNAKWVNFLETHRERLQRSGKHGDAALSSPVPSSSSSAAATPSPEVALSALMTDPILAKKEEASEDHQHSLQPQTGTTRSS
jgi:hypothetical protein